MMQKNPQTRVDILWIFMDFHRVLRVQSPSCTHGNFGNCISPLTVKSYVKFHKIFQTLSPLPPLLLLWLPELLGTLEYLNILNNLIVYILYIANVIIKGTVTDMRYFPRSKFSRNFVHKKHFSFIWQVVCKLWYVFCQER